MKKIYLFLLSGFISISLFAQEERKDTLLANFEDQLKFFPSGTSNVSCEVVPNPDKSGENLSDYVLKIEGNASHADWESLYTPNNTTTLSLNIDNAGGYRYLHFKVHKDFTSGMLWSFYPLTDEGTVGSQKLPEQKTNAKTGEWEYIVVDLLWLTETWNILPGTYCRINFNMTKTMDPRGAYVGYLDDVYLSNEYDRIQVPTGINTVAANKNIIVSRLDKSTVQVRIDSELKVSPKLDVYNMQGQLVRTIGNEQAAAKTFEVNLPAGSLYILRVSDEQGVYSIKF